jgi:copper homeostasis protein CutC
MTRLLLEIAVSSADEAALAVACGADRLELSCALELGGLTPSIGLAREVLAAVPVPVWALVRPRPGGFAYSRSEVQIMRADAEALMAAGADGIVTGVLDHENHVDARATARVVAPANGRAAFHRAFDLVADHPAALEELAALGFARVLTSGGAATALDGAARLAGLIRANRLEVLPGGSVRAANACELVRATGATQVHAACRARVSAGPAGMGDETALDASAVRALRAALDSLSPS